MVEPLCVLRCLYIPKLIESEVSFSFSTPSILEWAVASANPVVSHIDGGSQTTVVPNPERHVEFELEPGLTTITIELPLGVRVLEKNDRVSIYRGPLLSAHDIDLDATENTPLNSNAFCALRN